MSGLRRINAVVAKEFLHILHDPRSLAIIFLMPVVQLVMFGYAMNMEIQEVRLAVHDLDHTGPSADIVDAFRGSEFFTLLPHSGRPEEIDGLFKDGSAKAALIIYPGYAAGMRPALQLVIDASDPNTATLVNNYVTEVLQSFAGTAPPIDVRSVMLYNPGLVSSYFFVPGLVSLILVMICALLTSITVTREQETGTLEQLLVSPLKPLEFIIGKLLPYVGLSLVIGCVILLLGHVLFHVAFVGSPLLLLAMSLLYILVALSLGLMVSTVATSQLTAMMGALVTTLLPTMMLSGFIFPVASMPWPLQIISHIVPARYYLRMVRGILLKGNTLADLLPEALTLLVFFLFMTTVAWRRFHRKTR